MCIRDSADVERLTAIWEQIKAKADGLSTGRKGKGGVAPTRLQQISQLVARASGRPVAANKSIVGEAVFTHEAGIHVDGLLKNPHNYQGFDPAELGRCHRTVLGKHSGSCAVIAAYAALGLLLSDMEAHSLLGRIRRHATETKCAPTSSDLERFYLEATAADIAAVS